MYGKKLCHKFTKFSTIILMDELGLLGGIAFLRQNLMNSMKIIIKKLFLKNLA
jgi:hypothetical protein